MSSPTQRSLEYLRKNGFKAAVVEQWISFPDREHPGKTIRIKRDVWNFGDILAFHPGGNGALLVQTTTRAHQAERMSKIGRIAEAVTWLQAGNAIDVHGWAQVGARGKRKTWQVTVTPVTLGDIQEKVVERATQDELFA